MCTRCQMVCIDQSTGEKTREPLHTIAASFQGKIRFDVLSQWTSWGFGLFIKPDLNWVDWIESTCRANHSDTCTNSSISTPVAYFRGYFIRSGRSLGENILITAKCRLSLLIISLPSEAQSFIEVERTACWDGREEGVIDHLRVSGRQYKTTESPKSTRQKPKQRFTSGEWPKAHNVTVEHRERTNIAMSAPSGNSK
uniref:Uncharacterized protein n=1 Tax=Timema douglasi TaxID=61478 RepID=A0A7R8VMC4_TIMDO|nr:unnamed protein product [Timema douglasi]